MHRTAPSLLGFLSMILLCAGAPRTASAGGPIPFCDSPLVEIVFGFAGAACQSPLPNPQGGLAQCFGDLTGAADVALVYGGSNPDIVVFPTGLLDDGDEVAVSALAGLLDAQLVLLLSDPLGRTQLIEIHTSCSQPLALGDRFGSLTLAGITTVDGGVKPSPGTEDLVVDIKPGEEPNAINLGSNGVIPVAILGSDGFEVVNVDVSGLAFGPAGAPPVHAVGAHREDVNDDGFPDLVSHFATAAAGIAMGADRACLSGELLDGTPFRGCDSIRTSPRCGLGFEVGLVLPLLLRARRLRHGRGVGR